jgi:transposase InsO family protein
VHCRTDEGRPFRTLNIIDEYSRECLTIKVERKLNSTNVIDALTDLFILRGPPACIRSDNGPEFVALAVRDWMRLSAQKQLKSNREARGRLVTAKASTAGSVMSF